MYWICIVLRATYETSLWTLRCAFILRFHFKEEENSGRMLSIPWTAMAVFRRGTRPATDWYDYLWGLKVFESQSEDLYVRLLSEGDLANVRMHCPDQGIILGFRAQNSVLAGQVRSTRQQGCDISADLTFGFPMHWKLPLSKIPNRSHNASASSIECAEITMRQKKKNNSYIMICKICKICIIQMNEWFRLIY